jgi:hypothetical protein
LLSRPNSGVTVLQTGEELSFRLQTKLSIHSTDDLDKVLQDHSFVLDKERALGLPEPKGLAHADLFETSREQQEVRKVHVEKLLRSGRVLRCSAASHVSEASASGRRHAAARARDEDMMYYWVPSEFQVDLSDKSFGRRLGQARELWRHFTDKSAAGSSPRAATATFC